MSRTIEKTIYQFNELSDRAKERARDWYRSTTESDELTNYDDWTEIASILGIEFNQKPVPLMGGQTRYDPTIYWSGFSSQGDGAMFEGRYRYAKGSVKKMKEHAGMDSELHRIAQELTDVQRKHFYKLEAKMTQSDHHYCHSGCMAVEVFSDTSEYWNSTSKAFDESAEAITQLMRDFADWIYKQLSAKNDYVTSDEYIDELMTEYENEFDENGKRV